jgi:hypothetical protein
MSIAFKNNFKGASIAILSIIWGAALAPDAAYAQDNSLDATGDISLEISIPGSKCNDFIESKSNIFSPASPGPNKLLRGGGEVFLGVGSSGIKAPPDHPNYITSRENAFDVAFLQAKGELAKFIALKIKQDTKAAILEGKFTDEQPVKRATADGRSEDEKIMSSSWTKALKIVQNELDQELKRRGISDDQKPEKKSRKELEKEIEKVLSEARFSKVVSSAAKAQLKGLRRFFVHESSPQGKQGSICVVVIQSAKNEKIADAIFSRDASLAPKGPPGRPIRAQIPGKKEIRKLLTSYGVETRRDEAGNFWVLSFAQHGARGKGPDQINSALGYAQQRALGNLRAYVGEQMAVKAKTETSENAKELEKNMASYEFNNAKREEYSSSSEARKITGTRTLMKWAGRHPVSKAIVAGVIVAWSPSDMKSAQRIENSQKSRPSTGVEGGAPNAASGGNKFERERLNSGRGFEGSASGGTSSADF